MVQNYFDCMIMLRSDQTKVAKKKEYYGAKKPIKTWDVNFNVVISKLLETKNNSKHLIGYLDEVIRPLVLILPKMYAYVKTSKDKCGEKIRTIN